MKKKTLLIAIVMASMLSVNQRVYAGELEKESEAYTYEMEQQETLDQSESSDITLDEADKIENTDEMSKEE